MEFQWAHWPLECEQCHDYEIYVSWSISIQSRHWPMECQQCHRYERDVSMSIPFSIVMGVSNMGGIFEEVVSYEGMRWSSPDSLILPPCQKLLSLYSPFMLEKIETFLNLVSNSLFCHRHRDEMPNHQSLGQQTRSLSLLWVSCTSTSCSLLLLILDSIIPNMPPPGSWGWILRVGVVLINSFLYERLTDENFKQAIALWFENKEQCKFRFGHISDWNASQKFLSSDAFYLPFHLSTGDPSAVAGISKRKRRLVIELEGSSEAINRAHQPRREIAERTRPPWCCATQRLPTRPFQRTQGARWWRWRGCQSLFRDVLVMNKSLTTTGYESLEHDGEEGCKGLFLRDEEMPRGERKRELGMEREEDTYNILHEK